MVCPLSRPFRVPVHILSRAPFRVPRKVNSLTRCGEYLQPSLEGLLKPLVQRRSLSCVEIPKVP